MNSYLYIQIDGKSINKFLQKCYKNKINILNVRYLSYKSIVILINENEYKKLKKIFTTNKITIIGKTGKNRLIDMIKKYSYFIVSCFIGMVLLIFLSNIIFKIEIISDNNELKEIVKKELENYNIQKYKLMKSYDQVNVIKKNIINKYRDNIEWMEIKRNGTKYEVNIVERKVENIDTNNKIYSIVSTKSAVVRGIYTEKGISLVEKGYFVKKGDVLISSDIILNETIKKRVSAKGKVYGETWYKVKIEYPLNYEEKKYTSKRRTIPYIKLGNRYIEAFTYDYYDRETLLNFSDKFNNIEFGIEKIRKINVINDKYTSEQALEKAIEESKIKINQRLNGDEYIISQNTLNFYNNGSKIIVDIFFSVYEEIGELKEIEVGE